MNQVMYVEAPLRIDLDFYKNAGYKMLFLAGGISGCDDWQIEMVDFLMGKYADQKLIIFNPRRASYDSLIPNQEEIQISWEHDMLHASDLIFFYFARDQIQPIVLFEFGYWLGKNPNKVCYVAHRDYPRINDVWFQFKNVAMKQLTRVGKVFDDREADIDNIMHETVIDVITDSVDNLFREDE